MFFVHPIEAVPNSLFKSDFHSLIENDAYFRCQFCAKFDDCPFHKECRLSFANLSDWTILQILNIHFDPSASVGFALTLELNHICADDKRLRFLYLHVSESKIQYTLSFSVQYSSSRLDFVTKHIQTLSTLLENSCKIVRVEMYKKFFEKAYEMQKK